MARAIGSIDDLGRPVVRVEIPGRDDLLAVVDTGFNRSLMLLAGQAAEFGFAPNAKTELVELGTGAKVEVRRASGLIRWLGREMRVDALISNVAPPLYRPDMARALIGTELLAECRLVVDFVD